MMDAVVDIRMNMWAFNSSYVIASIIIMATKISVCWIDILLTDDETSGNILIRLRAVKEITFFCHSQVERTGSSCIFVHAYCVPVHTLYTTLLSSCMSSCTVHTRAVVMAALCGLVCLLFTINIDVISSFILFINCMYHRALCMNYILCRYFAWPHRIKSIARRNLDIRR